jgi:hypothetical protein
VSTMHEVKLEAEIDLMKAQTAKALAETRKTLREFGVMPFIAGAAVATACTTVAALILRYIVGM